MKIPFKYIFRSFKSRRLTTLITVAGIALVVFVFSAVLMMAYGIQKTLVATGEPDNVIIARKSANGEISSIVLRDDLNTVLTLPHIAKSKDGKPLASGETVVIINLNKKSGGLSNVTVRGVAQEAFILRPQVHIIEGRNFQPGAREVIVGSSIAKNFFGAAVGNTVIFGGDSWTIVGRFEAGKSGFDSEMWGDGDQLQGAFKRQGGYSTVTFKLDRPDAFNAFSAAFSNEPRLQQFEPKPEQKFFAEQSEVMALFIHILGIFITVVFSFGATIGAMITMYAAVANRTVEVGTMRALGFRRRSILSAFLTESLAIALIGGIVGLFLASFLQFFSLSTLNYGSFAELEFSFALSPAIIGLSLSFSLFMGFAGGFLPAARAARLKIVDALRSA
ncbi:MAG: ABC transporter permease [Bacteroidota bacterium]|jgi:ABC-type antimicrobial peptide transport system permease subunit